MKGGSVLRCKEQHSAVTSSCNALKGYSQEKIRVKPELARTFIGEQAESKRNKEKKRYDNKIPLGSAGLL